MKDQLFDPRHLLYSEDHMSQIMPCGPWRERDAPAIDCINTLESIQVEPCRNTEKNSL